MTDLTDNLRQVFTALVGGEEWAVTNVRMLPVLAPLSVAGTFTVEITALKDIDGISLFNQHTRAAKGTRIYYTVDWLQSGRLHQRSVECVPPQQPASGVGYLA